MPTLRDVAAEAGVTIATVSYVLNGRRDQVSEATFSRVLDAAQRLGYVGNASARALSAKRSGIIALVYLAPPLGSVALSNPHDPLFIGEVERHVTAADLHLMIRAAARPSAAVDSLKLWNVDGAIFINTIVDDTGAMRERHNVPMVFTDNYNPPPLISNVGIDDYRGGYLAGEHLALAGHTRIAWVGPPRPAREVMAQRYHGFIQAMSDHGLKPEFSSIVDCELSFDAAVAAGARLAASPTRPTAVFAPADLIAIGLIKGLTRSGLTVPTQVSVIGFDDLPVARQVTPELTTIRQDVPAKARAAVEMLLRLLAAGPDTPPERLTLDVSLVQRETVAVAVDS